jgi:hypothetical protein
MGETSDCNLSPVLYLASCYRHEPIPSARWLHAFIRCGAHHMIGVSTRRDGAYPRSDAEAFNKLQKVSCEVLQTEDEAHKALARFSRFHVQKWQVDRLPYFGGKSFQRTPNRSTWVVGAMAQSALIGRLVGLLHSPSLPSQGLGCSLEHVHQFWDWFITR